MIDDHPDWEISRVANHFITMMWPKSSVYRIINRILDGHDVQRKGGGMKVPKVVQEQMVNAAAGRIGVSFKSLGRQFGYDDHTVKKILLAHGVVQRRRKKVSKATAKQKKFKK